MEPRIAGDYAPQPTIPRTAKNHPLYREYMNYRSACAGQLVTASTFDSWLASKEMEAKRQRGELPYQIVNRHPRGQEYWAYSRAYHDKWSTQFGPKKGAPKLLSFQQWLESQAA